MYFMYFDWEMILVSSACDIFSILLVFLYYLHIYNVHLWFFSSYWLIGPFCVTVNQQHVCLFVCLFGDWIKGIEFLNENNLLYIQGCALRAPRCPGRLTFAFGRPDTLTFDIYRLYAGCPGSHTVAWNLWAPCNFSWSAALIFNHLPVFKQAPNLKFIHVRIVVHWKNQKVL